MTKMTLKYLDTLTRAETNVLQSMSPKNSSHVRRELDDDLIRLAALKRFVLQTIYEPGLPVTNIDLEHFEDDGSADIKS